MAWGCLFALAACVLAACFGSFYFRPYDEVEVSVNGVPTDTRYLCLVAERSHRPVVMYWSLRMIFPFTMHPDTCSLSFLYESETAPRPLRARVRWVTSERVGVLLKSKSGKWGIAWPLFPST